MVYPSGFARIARVEPVVPPAPATFSMTIDWPSVRDMGSLTMRADMSVPPPAGNGTIMVIWRDGKNCLQGSFVSVGPPRTKTQPLKLRDFGTFRWQLTKVREHTLFYAHLT